tara:strand:+ start:1127 stop:1327 length:201 start_codon:yes stop_codon:yes gene_type:complete
MDWVATEASKCVVELLISDEPMPCASLSECSASTKALSGLLLQQLPIRAVGGAAHRQHLKSTDHNA